jgi:hypothetical protein
VEVRRAYCSAMDRNVPVILSRDARLADRLTVTHPATLVCLDYPARCTGWCCPLHAAEDARAAEGRARAAAKGRSPDESAPADPEPPAQDPTEPSSRSKRWSRPT